MAPDAARVPVVAAVGQCLDRSPVAAVDLAARALDQALSGAPGLRGRIGRVSVVNVLSPVGPAPATELAARAGLPPATVEVSTIGGNSPQWLVNRAASAVAAGELDAAVVVGAEAQHSMRAGTPMPAPTAAAPDPVVGDDRPGVGPAELGAGLIAPVHVYALFESAIAHRAGRTPPQQRRALGELMAPFTAAAAAHPVAWFPTARTPEELAEVGPDNRLVAEPYPKRMCAVLHVNQAAAVVIASLATAREAGADDGAVFCRSGAEATEVWLPSARPDLGATPGLGAAARAALGAAGLGIDDVGAFDLYSCFPCAVEMALDALGLAADDPRGLTVTGGLPYFGGPGNNYSLHAVVTMVEQLRRQGGTGLVGALGWYATKHAVGVYDAAAPPRDWRRGDTAAEQTVIDGSALPVVDDVEGLEERTTAQVVASTVAYGRDGAVTAAPVVADLPDGRRLAAAAHPAELAVVAGRSLVGRRIVLEGSPRRYRVDA